ncbi:SH3 domain-containing protein [Verrucomicrobiales bacterium]|nr:SH3 domain-containing protein [Verrucomicrobiales bacterium]
MNLKIATAHKPSFEHTPKVLKGETIRFLKFDPKNPKWFFGADTEAIKGYFPCGWFEIEPATGKATAIRDYDGTELSVSPGDTISLIENYGDWSFGRSKKGIGWIPASCAEITQNRRD